MWRTRWWRRLYHKKGHRMYEALVEWCQYGQSWRKPTLFRGRASWIPELTRPCRGGHVHEVLEGSVRCPDGRWRSRTSLASEYAPEFCDRVFLLATPRTSAGYGLRAQRIGEASNPGPSLAGAHKVDLEEGVTDITREAYRVQIKGLDDWLHLHGFPCSRDAAELPSRIMN